MGMHCQTQVLFILLLGIVHIQISSARLSPVSYSGNSLETYWKSLQSTYSLLWHATYWWLWILFFCFLLLILFWNSWNCFLWFPTLIWYLKLWELQTSIFSNHYQLQVRFYHETNPFLLILFNLIVILTLELINLKQRVVGAITNGTLAMEELFLCGLIQDKESAHWLWKSCSYVDLSKPKNQLALP